METWATSLLMLWASPRSRSMCLVCRCLGPAQSLGVLLWYVIATTSFRIKFILCLQISANEDDLGLGGNAQSLIDGNSGPGVAWSIIGILDDTRALAALATTLPAVYGTVNAVAAMSGSVSGSISFAQTVRF